MPYFLSQQADQEPSLLWHSSKSYQVQTKIGVLKMPLTWLKAIEAFILINVFEAPDDGFLFKVLESAGYGDIWTLVTFHDAYMIS